MTLVFFGMIFTLIGALRIGFETLTRKPIAQGTKTCLIMGPVLLAMGFVFLLIMGAIR